MVTPRARAVLRLMPNSYLQGGGPTGIIGQEGEAALAGYEAWGAAPADPKYSLEFTRNSGAPE